MTTKSTEYTYKWKEKHPEKAAESHRLAQLKWRAKNRERVRNNQREWNKNNRGKANEYRRRGYYKLKYGITIEERNAMFAAQGNACAACGTDKPGNKGGWVVDHCHNSNKVRGILCHHCNLGIGNARDKIETMRKWMEYISRHA